MPPIEAAILRLRQCNAGTVAPTGEDASRAEEVEYQKLREEERLEEERRCPSLKSIPRFFEAKPPPIDESNSLLPRVIREARSHFLHRKSAEELLEEEDLHRILALLREYARKGGSEVIDYVGFARVREELLRRGERFRQLFTAQTFLKFPRDKNGCIGIVPFFTFIVRKVNISQTRVQLCYYDTLGRGYLREKDMENFIFELIPTLPQLNSLQEEFYPFYVFTAVRKFFFFLDPKRTQRIRIRDLLSSQILPELYELRQEHPMEEQEAANNWFSMQSALKVYGSYLDLDVSQNGMLSKSELKHFGHGARMLTDVFIDRVFEEYQTYRDDEIGEREMDYKTFLDFVLAMENKNTREALQYFWKAIDIHHAGYIDGMVINYFFGDIVRMLKHRTFDVASVDDVKNEIFDMVKSSQPGVITLQDLVNCRQGGVVLSMLIDAAAFWRYDNRETLLMEPDGDDDLSISQNF
jgi:Ca2+-binding EF-hand superfamily protein